MLGGNKSIVRIRCLIVCFVVVAGVLAIVGSGSTPNHTIKCAPNDYFASEFLTSNKDDELKQNILKFLEVIKQQGNLSDAYLMCKSINITMFKGNKYIKFDFDSGVVFNTLKLDNYDVAKKLFDEVVRKILNPLNDYISNPSEFYGYDLIIIGKTRNFANSGEPYKSIVYRFYMPENAVRAYKDKDITGQQLLDKSVILMDDERIDLKLQ